MSTEMIERAAKEICPMLPDVSASDCVQTHERTGNYANQPPCTPANCLAAGIARAAILAALDPEDETLLEQIARTLCRVDQCDPDEQAWVPRDDGTDGAGFEWQLYRLEARAAISALRASASPAP